MRISRLTLVSLILALLLSAGLYRWSLGYQDDCTRLLAGPNADRASQLVVTGTRTVVVPCRVWLLRQPTAVQILCLVDLLFATVFLLNLAGDIRAALAARAHAHSTRTEPL